MTDLVKAPPRAITPSSTDEESTERARASLAAARERLLKQLDQVHRALTPVTHWRDVVKRHPLVTIGGAFLVGYALAKLFSRK
jgi:ElaB/YqjD/DUF883 family membrane-anchored ribosome-binding protein